MTKKVQLAIFDEDLRCRKVGNYEVTDGNQIAVNRKSGKGHFMPHFDKYCGLEFPYRSILTPWKISWKTLYLVRKGAKDCVNFEPEKPLVPGPDPQLVIDTANAIMLPKLGEVPKQGLAWYNVVTVIFSFLSFLLLLGMSGAIR